MFSLSSLNPQQRLAVQTVNGPVLILAGAGTGKTRVITCRIAHMLSQGISAEQILGVTFTNKAAREMQERVREMVPRRAKADRKQGDETKQTRPTLCTFHSLCVRILRQHIERLGYKPNFVIYDEAEQLGAIKKILAQISARGEKIDPASVLSMVSRLRNNAGPVPFSDPSAQAMAEHIRARYEAALRACNAVDFDDLILLTLRLFREYPDALEACRNKYRYVMVDEFQDTNASQFELVHALTSKHRNLCVVGDDDQSIYGWRGAQISNILDMEKHFPEVRLIKLEQNYRSSNTILSAANALISRNVRRRGKQLWSTHGEGAKITLCAYVSDEEEARSVVEAIEYNRLAKRIPWPQQAILFRTNAQARPLETALRQAGVRYNLIGGQSFFDRREIRDFIAYLKVFINPHDDISLLRIANVPPRGLSDLTMERLLAASHERKCSVYAVMKNPAVMATFQVRIRESVQRLVDFVEGTRHQLAAPGASNDPAGLRIWASRFLDEIGFWQELKRSERTPEAGENRIRNVQEMLAGIDLAGVPAAPLPERLQTFLEEVALENDRDEDSENETEAVTLITMHSCKGLEFPHVFVVGLEDGLLPHTRSKEEQTVDEERRLFYVAITRAMKTLSISHCASRNKYGSPVPCHPSPFLKELPPEFVEDGDAKSKAPVNVETGKSSFAAMRAALDSL